MARMIAKTEVSQTKAEAVKEAKHTSKRLKTLQICAIVSLLINICLIVKLFL